MSTKQLERMLGVTYKTAWFLCPRIREAMDGATGNSPLGEGNKVVKADEPTSAVKAKQPVVAPVEREGHVRSFRGANVNAKELCSPIVTNLFGTGVSVILSYSTAA